MLKKISLVTALVFVLASMVWANTKLRNLAVITSTIDSSPVGSVSPSTGVFTNLTDSGGIPYEREDIWAGVPSNGAGQTACIGGNGACLEQIFTFTHTLTRLNYYVSQGPSGCSPNSAVGVRDATTATVLFSISFTQATGTFVDSGAISVSLPAGHRIQLGIVAGASGCFTGPILQSVSAILQ